MNHEQAQSIALKLSSAGFALEVIMTVEQPIETCYSVIAQKLDQDGNCWMFIHLRDLDDVRAITDLLRITEARA
jgi:hypothetical protein